MAAFPALTLALVLAVAAAGSVGAAVTGITISEPTSAAPAYVKTAGVVSPSVFGAVQYHLTTGSYSFGLKVEGGVPMTGGATLYAPGGVGIGGQLALAFEQAEGVYDVIAEALEGSVQTVETEPGAVIVDNTPPAAPPGSVITAERVNPGDPYTILWLWPSYSDPVIVDGAGSVPGSGVDIYRMTIMRNGVDLVGPIGVSPVIVPNTWAWGLPAGSDGLYQLKMVAVDKVGNASAPLISGDYVIDTTGPTFSNALPAHGFETNDPTTRQHVDVTDGVLGSGLDIAGFHWYVGEPGVEWPTVWNGTTLAMDPMGPLAPGLYKSVVTARDMAGISSMYPGVGTWDMLIDTTAPELVVLGPPQPNLLRDGKVFTGDKNATIAAIVADPASPLPSGFNASGTLAIGVFEDAACTIPVAGTSTPDPRPAGNADPWRAVWTAPAAGLADGDYYVKVMATDDAGNSMEWSDFSFTVDTTAPSMDGEAEVGALNESNGNRFTNGREITATWEASADPVNPDGSTPVGLLGYSFEIWTKEESDTVPSGTRLYNAYWYDDIYNSHLLRYVGPSGSAMESWSSQWPLPFESGKSYGVWLKSWDRLHNQSAWFDPPFIFDPDVPSDPADVDVARFLNPLWDPSLGRVIADSTPELQWTHSTDSKPVAQSGVDLYEVEVTVAGTTTWDVLRSVVDIEDEDVDLLDGNDAALAGTFSWTIPTALADGSYQVRVRAKDVAGNYSGWTTTGAFTIDTTPPPVPGMPTTQSPTRNTAPTWDWADVDDADGDLSHYNVYSDGELLVAVTDSQYEPAVGLAHGVHVLEVTSVDLFGNESARSTAGHVMIDIEKPTVPELDPMPEWVRPGTIRFSWSAAADDLAVTYGLYLVGTATDGIGWFTSTVSGLTSQAFDAGADPWIASKIATGEWTINAKVKAIDAVGNQSDWSAVRTVKTDITLPTVVFTAEPSGTINNPRPTWEWEGTDARSGIGHYLVQLDDEPSFTTRDTMWTPASNLADGEHILRVQAVDVVGNVSEWLVSDAVVIDTIPPAVPGIPEPEETPTKLTTPAWTWKASAGAASYNVYLDDEPIANVTEPEFTTADYATFGVAALAEGRHNMQVTALDEWGNESDMSGTGHVLVDLTPPEVPELDPLPPFTKADMIRFVWTAVDGAVSYDLEGIANGVKIPVYTLDIAAKVTGDVVATRVRAYDSVGNVSEWSAAVSTIVDRTGPTTTAVTTPPATTNTTRPTWGWSGDDAGLSGVAYYIVTLDGQPPFNTTGTSFTPAHDLPAGAHTLTVQAVDALGNIGNLLEFATTIVVEPVIIDVIPLPGTYTIDRVSTLVLNITGMMDAPLEVAVGANALETWRIVELYRTPASTKFYVLLDEEVLMPGRLVLTVDAGMTQRTFIYEVLNERSGFGFGRMRPW